MYLNRLLLQSSKCITMQLQLDNSCHDCGMKFESPYELLNHEKNFCANSGYGTLSQAFPSFAKPNNKGNNKLRNYGELSLNNIIRDPSLASSGVSMQTINLDQHRNIRPITNPKQSNVSSKSSKNSLARSLIESLNDIDDNSYVSPPTQANFAQKAKMPSMLKKSASSYGRLPEDEKQAYALAKLIQLEDIKKLYTSNDGRNQHFIQNTDKMIAFYKNMLTQIREAKATAGFKETISRASTPIDTLKQFSSKVIQRKKHRQQNVSQNNYIKQHNRQILATSKVENNKHPSETPQQTNKMPIKNGQVPTAQHWNLSHPPYYPPPQVIMIPPYQQSHNDSASQTLKILQKMLEVKNTQNKQLISLLAENKQRQEQFQHNQKRPYTKRHLQSKNKGSSVDNYEEWPLGSEQSPHYLNIQKQAIDLPIQQKVHLALQRQQLDELKLLSYLPPELQKIKMESIVKNNELRYQMELEVLKQRFQRLSHNNELQQFQELRRIQNDEWVSQKRKNIMQETIGSIDQNHNQAQFEEIKDNEEIQNQR